MEAKRSFLSFLTDLWRIALAELLVGQPLVRGIRIATLPFMQPYTVSIL